MKNIYRLLLGVIILVWSYSNCFSQATLTMGNINGIPGNSLSVPVQATGISDMVGFQFTITYDKTKLTYVNCTNWGGGTNAAGVQITPLDGKITFIYNDVAVNIASGKFFDLNFTVVNGSSGNTLLSWSDNPTARELSNSIPAEISCAYTNGSVTITSSGTSPVANFSATPINDCTPLTVNFADESTGNPTSWAWDIDNNGTVDYTIKNPIHTYNIAGTYSVKLTATNVSGSDSKTRLSYITANSTVSSSVSISASPSTIISSGQLVTFTATPINGGTNPTFVWKVNGVIEGNNNPTYSTSSLTNGKVVTCVMTSNSPCVSSASATSNSLIMTVNSTGASLIIGNINGVAGNAVSVPVTVSNLSDVVGFQFTITYDKTKLTYVNCTNWGGGANASGVQITPLDGKITFIYNDVAVNIASGKFFDLNFTVVNGSSGSALLSWSDNPTARELSNSIPAEISCSYANGSITITDCIAVSIASQPSDQKADIGSTATFSVTANGTAPFLYFWYKNGIQIAGATSSTYTTPVLTTADNGNTYYCNLVNCNAQSGITSRTATLIVSTGTCIPPLIHCFSWSSGKWINSHDQNRI
jgi:PKD repeat protein